MAQKESDKLKQDSAGCINGVADCIVIRKHVAWTLLRRQYGGVGCGRLSVQCSR